jgi:hypothetical protein
VLTFAACGGNGNGSQMNGVPGASSGDGGLNLGNPQRLPDGGIAPRPPKDGGVDAGPLESSAGGIDRGSVPVGTFVHVAGLTLVGPVRSAGPDQTGACTYDAYLEDPTASAPSGLRIFVDGWACPDDAAACACAPVGAITTKLDALTDLGDLYDVVGYVSRYTFDGGADEHSVYATTVTKTGTGAAPPSPLVITNPGALFAPGGAGFAQNEGMLVTLSFGAPTAVVPTGTGVYTVGGARFLSAYPIASDDGGTFPAPGSQWSSITGVAFTAYGGAIAPRSAADFTP